MNKIILSSLVATLLLNATSYSSTGDYANHLKGSSLSLSNDFTFGFNATFIF